MIQNDILMESFEFECARQDLVLAVSKRLFNVSAKRRAENLI